MPNSAHTVNVKAKCTRFRVKSLVQILRATSACVISVLGFVLSLAAEGLLTLFLGIYYKLGSALLRTDPNPKL